LVLLVGGDDATARSCARNVSPLPILRAKHLTVAADRLRAMRPVAVVVAADVPLEDARELERLAVQQATAVIMLENSVNESDLRRIAKH
jgi:hypothetical protein